MAALLSPPAPDLGPSPTGRIRVLVVDDSAVIRRVLARILGGDPALEVVGFAVNGAGALAQAAELRPDAITMDIEMPGMDGLEAVRVLRQRGSKAVIVMCSTLTSRGAAATIEALVRGANDYVTKPSNGSSAETALEGLRLELLPKIKQFFPQLVEGKPRPPRAAAAQTPAQAAALPAAAVPAAGPGPLLRPVPSSRAVPLFPPEKRLVVAMGVSTGGPTALMRLLSSLPASFPVPIVIVQHMPPIFTRQLAERLSSECSLEVLEAAEGEPLLAGRVLLAPGDYHMRLKRVGGAVTVTLDQRERENSCRPAVDVLFRSVLEVYGGQALGVVLTGMGQDGLRGVERLRDRGAYILAQDRESSVVWGMPGAVVEAGLADAVLGLEEMAQALQRQVPSR